MNQLPPELTRLPLNALDVIRYMGRAGIERADRDTLAEGAGMSERGIGQAIRGLVTKGYLNMDEGYIYFLTEKGQQALQDIREFDAAQPSGGTGSNKPSVVEQHLIAVTPNPVGLGSTSSFLLGLEGIPPVSYPSQLVLRLSCTSGSLSSQEITLELQPNQPIAPAQIHYQPAQDSAVRIRVEAVQLIDIEVHPAGGMFFDLNLSAQGGGQQAWYGRVNLQP